MQIEMKIKAVVTLISDKTNFKTKAIMSQKMTQYYDNGINPTRGYNPCKYLCTKHSSTRIYKANLDGHKRRD